VSLSQQAPGHWWLLMQARLRAPLSQPACLTALPPPGAPPPLLRCSRVHPPQEVLRRAPPLPQHSMPPPRPLPPLAAPPALPRRSPPLLRPLPRPPPPPPRLLLLLAPLARPPRTLLPQVLRLPLPRLVLRLLRPPPLAMLPVSSSPLGPSQRLRLRLQVQPRPLLQCPRVSSASLLPRRPALLPPPQLLQVRDLQ
jgi:WAS/WASL-interacting protein